MAEHREGKRRELVLWAARLRRWVLEEIHAVGIGHLGGSLSVCDLLAVLYFDQMRVDAKNPKWPDRDRFVMSKGHAGPAVYAALALRGFFPLEQLYTLNQPHTNLPSHCDMNRTPGIDMTTGSLGQGISCAMGIAMACRAAGRDNDIYVVLGDGESQEGQVWEAALFAAQQKLEHVFAFLDYNHLQIDGRVDDICSLQSPLEKFAAFGWHVQEVDGHDVGAIRDAIIKAKHVGTQPHMIVMHTIKGYGVPEIENLASSHNCPVDDKLYASACARFDTQIAALEQAVQSPEFVPCVPDEPADGTAASSFYVCMSRTDSAAHTAHTDEAVVPLTKQIHEEVSPSFHSIPKQAEEPHFTVYEHITESREEMRTAFCEAMMELAKKDERVFLLDADLMGAMGTKPFAAAYPTRTIDCGIQEANMIGVAAGLSAEGYIPFAHTFAVFATRRACDQVYLSCAYAKQHVKLVGSDPGITAALNGGTHMAFEDLGIMRTIPEMTILEPTDIEMIRDLIPKIAAYPGVVYLRLVRRTCPQVYRPGSSFVIGRANVLRPGRDVTLIAMGFCVSQAYIAAEMLQKEGIDAGVIDMFTLKPIDRAAVKRAAFETGAIVTAENHNIMGGLGSAVAEVIAEEVPAVLRRVGARDCFGQVGKRDFLAAQYHLTAQDICTAARQAIFEKNDR